MALSPANMTASIQSFLAAAGYPPVSADISLQVITAICQGIIASIQADAEATGTCPSGGGPLTGGRVV